MKVGDDETNNTTVGSGSLNATNDVTVQSTTGATGSYIEVSITGISKGVKCYYISYTYDDGQGSNLTNSDLALTGAPIALNFDLYNNSTAQTVSYTTSSTGAVTVSGGEGYVTTSVSGNTITVTPVAVTPSAQTITVSQAADNTYAAGSKTFTVTVANSDPNVPGTEANPYTVAQAIANTPSSGNVYIRGIVSSFYNTSIIGDGTNYRYYISDDGSTTTQLLVYKGKGLNETTFSNADDLQVGDEVTIYGSLITYQNAPEVASGNYLVSLNRPVNTNPVINANNVTLDYDATSGEIAYTIDNPVNGENLSATTDANWISNIAVLADKVTFTTTANEGNADRTANFTLSYTGATNKTVTVTQGHFSVDYATLPFAYDGNGTGTLPTGFTVQGLGTYNSSPAMKFDGNGDYAILKINERPGVLTFDIKGNTFSGGTFKVQTSTDGTTYTDLKTYTDSELGSASIMNEEFDNLDENVRYIKWIYTNKSSGNVALGNINLAKYVAPSNDPVINANDVDIACDDVSGSIDYSVSNEVQGGVLSASVPANSWITLGTVTASEVPFTCSENSETTARTETVTLTYTYNTNETVTKDVTVTQAAYVAPAQPGNWVLTNLADLTASDVFVIVGTDGDGDTYALPNNGGTNAPSVESVTIVSGTLSGEPDANLQWNISGNATNGYTFYPNGDSGNWLYCSTTAESGSNNNIKVGTGDRKTFVLDSDGYLVTNDSNTDRYLSIFVNSGTPQDWRGYVNTNSAVAISFYKKVITETVEIGTYGMATFCSDKALDFENVSNIYAYKASVSGNNISFTRVYQVPAGTGVLLRNPNGGQASEQVPVISSADPITENAFFGTLTEIASLPETSNGNTNYILFYTEQEGLGFYKANNNFVGAGKAYLQVPNGAKAFIAFEEEGEATGINNVNREIMTHNGCYNLNGQRVENPTKGLYIVNGKKVVLK